MATEFRDFLQRLIERGELRRVSEELDLRQLSAPEVPTSIPASSCG